MYDRINWFQGWIIILMLFSGIVMLVHYETEARDLAAEYQRQAQLEHQIIRADIAFVKQAVRNNQEEIDNMCAGQHTLGLVDSWAAEIRP